MKSRQHGTTLLVGLMLLMLVTLLGLAGAATAHIEAQLAHNEQFRENAASAASAGVEVAISRIVSAPEPMSSFSFSETLPGSAGRVDVQARFLGYDVALPQAAGANLGGAHFEILSTAHSSRRAVDRQRAIVMRVVAAPDAAMASECEPAVAGVHCHAQDELLRLSWQRLP
jgi:type II secretory pathway component PulK